MRELPADAPRVAYGSNVPNPEVAGFFDWLMTSARADKRLRLRAFRRPRNFPRSNKRKRAALAETDEVKNAAAARQRRLKIRTSLGQAMMWSKGYIAEETKAAFAHAREPAAAIDNPTERFTIYHGLCLGDLPRGKLEFAREIAERFLREAERGARRRSG